MMKNTFITACMLSLLCSAVSCQKLNDLIDTPSKMDGMSNKMDGMNANMKDLARQEKVKAAVQELNDTKNYKKLTPVPTDIIPWAKIAAENMKVDEELVPYIYMKMTDITSLRFDDNNPGESYDLSNPNAVEFEKNKLGLFFVISAISGFLPEEKVTQLLQRLENSEEYTRTAIQILALRSYFINGILMREKYKEDALMDLGSIEQAIQYNQSLDRINKLQYVDKIRTDISSFVLFPDYNQALSVTVDQTAVAKNWASIYAGMQKYYKVGQYSSGQGSIESQKKRFNAALTTVLSELKKTSLTSAQ